MIHSRARQFDIHDRQENLKILAGCLRMYKKTGDREYLKYAKTFGEFSEKINNRLKKNDYREEDKFWSKVIHR